MKLLQVSDQQSAGKLAGVFVMGAISALIVGPCVAAPLAGTLMYISQTCNAIGGGSALFAMAVGMSVLLLCWWYFCRGLAAACGGMDGVGEAFLRCADGGRGALWMVSPVIPTPQCRYWVRSCLVLVMVRI